MATASPEPGPKQPPSGPPSQSDSPQWVNPTGGRIRDDDRGFGGYGERRDGGTRRHAGVDYAGKAGDPVRAPSTGALEIINDGVWITEPGSKKGARYSFRMLHFDPSVSNLSQVKAGQIIGTLQDISKKYKRMNAHVHMEVYELDEKGKRVGDSIDSSKYVPKP